MDQYIELQTIYHRFDLFLQEHPIDSLDQTLQVYSLFKEWYQRCFPHIIVPCRPFLLEYLSNMGYVGPLHKLEQ